MEEKIVAYRPNFVKDRVFLQCFCGQEILEFVLSQWRAPLFEHDYPEFNILFHGASRLRNSRNLDFAFSSEELSRFVGNWSINLEDRLIFKDKHPKGGYLTLMNDGLDFFVLSRYENEKNFKRNESNWDCIIALHEFKRFQEELEKMYSIYDKMEAMYEEM